MKKRVMRFIALLFIITWVVSLTVYAMEREDKIRFQGTKEEGEDIQKTKNAVPQGMATDGKYIYLVKNREAKEGSEYRDVSYILKIKDPNSSNPKLILPMNSLKVGHANGMTYYDGFLYIANKGQKLYKVKDIGGNQNTAPMDVVWNIRSKNNKKDKEADKKKNERGTEEYSKDDTYTLAGESGEEIKNIAHYSGKYFIVCLKSEFQESQDRTNKLTYGIGVIEGSQFVIKKRFIVSARNTYPSVQDIEYSNGELWIVLSEYHNDSSTSLRNQILRVKIPSSFDAVENNKIYEPRYANEYSKPTRKKNSKGKWEGTIREVESVCVIGDKYYVWSNIIEGWNETLCRYKEKNARTEYK